MRHILLLLVTAFVVIASAAQAADSSAAAPAAAVPIEERVAPASEMTDPYPSEQADIQAAADIVIDPHAAQSGGLPQFDPTWFPSQIFWLVVTFGILFVVMSNTILPALGKTLGNRRTQLESDLKAAEDMSSEARNLQDTVQRGLQRAQGDAVSIIADAGKVMSQEVASRQAAFHDKAQSQMDALQKNLDKAAKKARADMEDSIADLVSDVLGKTAGVKMAGKDIRAQLNRDEKSEAA